MFDFNSVELAGPESDNAPDGIVRRDANRHSISGDDFDPKAAHPAAELGEHLVSGIALHSVKATAMHSDDGTLHVDEVVLAQSASNPSIKQTLCHIATAARRLRC